MCHGTRTRLAQTAKRPAPRTGTRAMEQLAGRPYARVAAGNGHAKAHVPRRDGVPERHQWSTIDPSYMQRLPRSRPLIGSAPAFGRGGIAIEPAFLCLAIALLSSGWQARLRAHSKAQRHHPRRCRKTLNIKSENRLQWASAAPPFASKSGSRLPEPRVGFRDALHDA